MRNQIWDTQIVPHLKNILTICQEHNIPFIAIGDLLDEPHPNPIPRRLHLASFIFMPKGHPVPNRLIVAGGICCPPVIKAIGSTEFMMMCAKEFQNLVDEIATREKRGEN